MKKRENLPSLEELYRKGIARTLPACQIPATGDILDVTRNANIKTIREELENLYLDSEQLFRLRTMPPNCVFFFFDSTREKIIESVKFGYEYSKELPSNEAECVLRFLMSELSKCIQFFCKITGYDNEFKPTVQEIKQHQETYRDFYSIAWESMDDGRKAHYGDISRLAKINLLGERRVAYSGDMYIYDSLTRLRWNLVRAIKNVHEKTLLYQNAIPKDDPNYYRDMKINLSDFFTKESEELFMRLRDLMTGKKGKGIAIIIQAMKNLKLVTIDNGEYARFYEALRLEFGLNIGSDESINKYLIRGCNSNDLRPSIEEMEGILIQFV